MGAETHRGMSRDEPLHLLDVTLGYGYQPWMPDVWLLALTLLGTEELAPTPVPPHHHPRPVDADHVHLHRRPAQHRQRLVACP